MKRFICFGFIILLSPALWASDPFPGRSSYYDVPVIELDDLAKKYTDMAIVDVRSEYEYNTLHISDAINIPLSSLKFVKQVRNLRRMSNKPIVFYCNGHTCMKSYKAVNRAKAAKINDVSAFDAGIFDWATAYPDRTMLLGKKLAKSSRLISPEDFSKRLISPGKFSKLAKSKNKNVMVVDVRDRMQRSAAGLFQGYEEWVPLDKEHSLSDLIKKAKSKKKKLLIYDEVGQQVRWLQYRIKRIGHSDYYFMQGGAKAYLEGL